MSSDLLYAKPGDRVTVEVEADSNGDVALRGDGVHVKGATNRNPLVELTEAQSELTVGILDDDPEEWADTDTQSDFSAGDNLGKAPVLLGVHVFMVAPDSGYTPSVADFVNFIDGGVVDAVTGPTATSVSTLTNTLGVDGSGVLETDAGSDVELDFQGEWPPWGFVFDVNPAGVFAGSDKIAVARVR